MVSRNMDLNPIVMPKSRFGYLYPFITFNFPERDDARMFDVIELIEKEHLADFRFVDRIHLCPNCKSSFLNFREICPRCSSANLSTDDLVHHFACGFVGPQQEFKKEERLVCVKCGKILRHIGMDYDKPSIIHSCSDCGYSFQNPQINGFYLYCQESTLGENLIVKDIKSFQISQVTENCALNGIIISLSDILNESMKVYSRAAFGNILEYEYKRQKRNNSQSVLVYLEFGFDKNSNVSREVIQEIFYQFAKEIKDILRSSDVITALSNQTFAILMPDVTFDGARKAMERLHERSKRYVEKNFNGVKFDFVVEYLTLQEAMETDSFIKNIPQNG